MEQLGHALAIGLAFGITVFAHEAGHFIAARLSGMAVHEFSIGFGRPLLFWLRRGQTQYSFRLWPFFSYVRIAGMEPGDDHPQGFGTKSRAAQALVLVLGCVMNFLLGVAIFIVMGAVLGRPVDVTQTVRRALPGEPAAVAGIVPGDRLVGYDGRTGLSLAEIQKHIQGHANEPITLEIDRQGERLSVDLTPKQVSVPELQPADGEDDGGEPGRTELIYRKVGRIGVVFELKVEKMGAWESVKGGFVDTYRMVLFLIRYFYEVVGGKMPLVLQGPVGVAHTLYEESRAGWMSFLSTAAALTVGIGFLNLLPIPPLDGSRLVITAVEAIRRRPIDKHKENLVHLIGFGLLLALVIVLTYRDILRIAGIGEG